MPIINKGTAFSNGEQLTADKLNDLVDLATFDQSATDSASTTVNTSGQIAVKDSGVSTSKIADANVTFAKLADVIDDDTMATATATTLATSESIKAYADGGDIGVGQTWQSVTRDLDGTSYTNNTGKPIMVKGRFDGNTDNHDIDIAVTPSGGSTVTMRFATSINSGGGVASNGSIIIPNNTSYSFTKSGDTINSFAFHELR